MATITLESLVPYFDKQISDAAKALNTTAATLLEVCHNHGIPIWPNKMLHALDDAIASLEKTATTTPDEEVRRKRTIEIAKAKREFLLKNPAALRKAVMRHYKSEWRKDPLSAQLLRSPFDASMLGALINTVPEDNPLAEALSAAFPSGSTVAVPSSIRLPASPWLLCARAAQPSLLSSSDSVKASPTSAFNTPKPKTLLQPQPTPLAIAHQVLADKGIRALESSQSINGKCRKRPAEQTAVTFPTPYMQDLQQCLEFSSAVTEVMVAITAASGPPTKKQRTGEINHQSHE